MKRISKQTFLKSSDILAKEMLGKTLWRKTDFGLIGGKITETEAYLSKNDFSCHASTGKSKRNESMFEEGGISYVYFIYGCYFCFNIVSGEKDSGEAVLIRALEPIAGTEIIYNFRNTKRIMDLTNGPGKLCQALNIDKSCNGINLITSDELFISEPEQKEDFEIITTTRIGITKSIDLPLRFYIKGNEFVSKKT